MTQHPIPEVHEHHVAAPATDGTASDGRDRLVAEGLAMPGPSSRGEGGGERAAEQGGAGRSATQRGEQHGLTPKRATYLSLMGLFGGLFVAFSARERGRRRTAPPPIRPFDFVLLALSVFRLARIVSSDQIAEPLRAPVTKEAEEGSEPKGRGAQRALGELVSCPLCIGVWISAVLSYGLLWLPGPTRVLLAIFGAAGAAEALNFTMSALDATTKSQTRVAEEGASS
jgi:hypothetical protein